MYIDLRPTTIFGNDCLLFTIKLAQGTAYMQAKLSSDTTFSVVAVNSKEFIYLWRANFDRVHPELALGNRKVWMKDYKYRHAEDGFSHGIENPVPLADIKLNQFSAFRPTLRQRIELLLLGNPSANVSFINGITRTIWLLSHGAKEFPVRCCTSQAPLLAQLAGGRSFMPIELTPR